MPIILILCIFNTVPPAYYDQRGYAPQQPGYHPPQQSYQPMPPQMAQTSNTNVIVVGGGGPPVQQTTVIEQPREQVNHLLHCIISFFFFPWILIWCCLCCMYGCWLWTFCTGGFKLLKLYIWYVSTWLLVVFWDVCPHGIIFIWVYHLFI